MSTWLAGSPAVETNRAPLSKRGRICIWKMMLTATSVIVAVGCTGNEPGSAPETPASAGPPRVVFYAEGEGTKSAAVTMRTESGGTVQKDVALPLHNAATGTPGIDSTAYKRGDQLYFSMQNRQGAGSVTCRIEVDGQVIDEATSSGGYKIATCVGKVP